MLDEKYVIGISGGTCSGKTTLAIALQEEFGRNSSVVLSMDSYYLSPNPNLVNHGKVNFDHPDAIDLKLFNENLTSLINGDSVNSPVYNRCSSKRVGSQIIMPAPIIIVEGLFTLWDDKIRKQLNLKVFLDIEADIRLGRRMMRDVIEFGIDLEQVYQNYVEICRPMYLQFTDAVKHYADLILKYPISIKEEMTTIIKHKNQDLHSHLVK